MTQTTAVLATPTVEEVIAEILNVATTIAAVFPVGAEVAGAIKLATTIGNGIAHACPAIRALYANIKAAADGGAAPTAEQWAEYNAAADTAHLEFLAAVAEARKAQTG